MKLKSKLALVVLCLILAPLISEYRGLRFVLGSAGVLLVCIAMLGAIFTTDETSTKRRTSFVVVLLVGLALLMVAWCLA